MTGMSATIIRNGRIIDPANNRDEIGDLLIVDGLIASLSQLSTLNSQPDEIDATNLIVYSRPHRPPRAPARTGVRLEGND